MRGHFIQTHGADRPLMSSEQLMLSCLRGETSAFQGGSLAPFSSLPDQVSLLGYTTHEVFLILLLFFGSVTRFFVFFFSQCLLNYCLISAY